MPTPPIGRRQFVVNAGGVLFCTLAGHRLTAGSKVDLDHLGSQVPVPPKVRAAKNGASTTQFVSDTKVLVLHHEKTMDEKLETFCVPSEEQAFNQAIRNPAGNVKK